MPLWGDGAYRPDRPCQSRHSSGMDHCRTYLQVNFPKVREEELLAMHSELGDGTTQIRENRCVIEGPLISPRPNDGRATISKTGEFSDLGEVKLPYPYGFSPRSAVRAQIRDFGLGRDEMSHSQSCSDCSKMHSKPYFAPSTHFLDQSSTLTDFSHHYLTFRSTN